MIFQIHKRIRLGAVLVGAVIATMASTAANATPVIPPGFSAVVMDANIDAGYNTITNIAVFTQTSGGTGYGRYFTANPGPNEFVTVIPPQAGVIETAFGAGVIAGLPGDPQGSVTDHLVIFGDFTSDELNMDFASLFPGISESSIIQDLLTTPYNQPLPRLDVNTFTADARSDGLYGGNGSSFSAVAFSGGTVIGDGTITLVTPVPEPISVAIFAAGLAGISVTRRRKRSVL